MNRHLKKVWPALAISLVLATSFVNAADNADMTRSKPNMDTQRQQRGSMGMITPPVNPAVQGVDFSLGVEALYMRATQDSSAVGDALPASGTYPQTYEFVAQQYDWSWGFRVDAGYAMAHDGWDLQGQWTWFHSSHTHDRHSAGGYTANVLPSTASSLTNPDVAIASTDLNSNRRLYINVGELDLGREFFISKWLTLRPHVGAKGLWIHRQLSVKSVGITSIPTNIASTTNHVGTQFRGQYSGGGIYAGLDSQWGFGDGWSLFGTIDQSLVYGRNSYRAREVDTTSNGAHYTRGVVENKWNTVRGITDLAIGLRWDYLFDNDRYRFRLQAAWEEHLFSNLIVDDFGASGDLALTGASFKASFDF